MLLSLVRFNCRCLQLSVLPMCSVAAAYKLCIPNSCQAPVHVLDCQVYLLCAVIVALLEARSGAR